MTLSPVQQYLGCNNGIGGGFHENLVTFRDLKLPAFVWAQTMRLKKMHFLGAIKKRCKSGPVAPKRKVVETLYRYDCHRPKIGPNPNILAYSKSP